MIKIFNKVITNKRFESTYIKISTNKNNKRRLFDVSQFKKSSVLNDKEIRNSIRSLSKFKTLSTEIDEGVTDFNLYKIISSSTNITELLQFLIVFKYKVDHSHIIAILQRFNKVISMNDKNYRKYLLDKRFKILIKKINEFVDADLQTPKEITHIAQFLGNNNLNDRQLWKQIMINLKKNITKFTINEQAQVLWSMGRVGMLDKDFLSVSGELLSYKIILFEIAKEKGYQYVHDNYGIDEMDMEKLMLKDNIQQEGEDTKVIKDIKLLDGHSKDSKNLNSSITDLDKLKQSEEYESDIFNNLRDNFRLKEINSDEIRETNNESKKANYFPTSYFDDQINSLNKENVDNDYYQKVSLEDQDTSILSYQDLKEIESESNQNNINPSDPQTHKNSSPSSISCPSDIKTPKITTNDEIFNDKHAERDADVNFVKNISILEDDSASTSIEAMYKFNDHKLAMILKGFSQLNLIHPKLFELSASYIINQADQFNLRSIVMILQSFQNLGLTHNNLINRILIRLNNMHVKYELSQSQDKLNLLVGLINCLSKFDKKKFNQDLVHNVIDKFSSYALTKIELDWRLCATIAKCQQRNDHFNHKAYCLIFKNMKQNMKGMSLNDAIELHKYQIYNTKMIRDSRDTYLQNLPVNPNVALKLTLIIIGRKSKNSSVAKLDRINSMVNNQRQNISNSYFIINSISSKIKRYKIEKSFVGVIN